MNDCINTTAPRKTQDLQYVAIIEIVPTRIGDFYRLKLAQALATRSKASQTKNLEARDTLRENAWKLERDASNLAHCLAKFGDLNLNELDLKTLFAEIQSATCMGTNPWARGLALIEKMMQKTDPQATNHIDSGQ